MPGGGEIVEELPMARLRSPVHGTIVQGPRTAGEQRVSGGLVFGARRLHPAVIDRKVAREPELGRNRRNLALTVGLHDAA